jgi:hypothetical protein
VYIKAGLAGDVVDARDNSTAGKCPSGCSVAVARVPEGLVCEGAAFVNVENISANVASPLTFAIEGA